MTVIIIVVKLVRLLKKHLHLMMVPSYLCSSVGGKVCTGFKITVYLCLKRYI